MTRRSGWWRRWVPHRLRRGVRHGCAAGHVGGEGGVADPGQKSEQDVQVDRGVARTRATGGVPDAAATDQGSTTGTTPSRTFVGRIAGDDPGYSEETGAEIRAAARRARTAGRRPGRRPGRPGQPGRVEDPDQPPRGDD